jgi:predicted patatin/cPLA2 family phospholipase
MNPKTIKSLKIFLLQHNYLERKLTRKWRNYNLEIQPLFWARNLMDGYNVFVYKESHHIMTINIDYNLNKITID